MGIFSRLFGNRLKPKDKDDAPPIYGGNGSSPDDAAVVNCASMSIAHHLIDKFISERHGEKAVDWDRGAEYFVNEPDIPEFTVRAITVNTIANESPTYFFDISRPISAAKKLTDNI